jgi:hypothetical protein
VQSPVRSSRELLSNATVPGLENIGDQQRR